ncbi:MAG: hypothetical protein KQH63_15455 [Desulfobulbaceae bacterium]|nr:hypothetical protein [Desulfobulbaceae bacterium]
MNTKKISTKKIFSTIAVLMLLSASQASAGSVTLNGQVDDIWDSTLTGITYSSPLSVTLGWADGAVSSVGETFLTLSSMTIDFDGLRLTQSSPHTGDNPTAHFSDGVIDGFELDWWGATVDGVAGTDWSIYATTDPFYGFSQTGDIYFELADFSLEGLDWIEASLNLPAPGSTSPVPLPGAVWMLGAGLLGLRGLRGKNK